MMTKTKRLSAEGAPLYYSRVIARLGSILVAYRGSCPYFVSLESASVFCAWVASQDHAPLVWVPRAPSALALALRAAADDGQTYEGPVDLVGQTAFRRQVLAATRKIPRGETRTYRMLAASLGRPGAARAVGTALAQNPLPLLVPCHRVVAANRRLGQYSDGGPSMKRRLLANEGVGVADLR